MYRLIQAPACICLTITWQEGLTVISLCHVFIAVYIHVGYELHRFLVQLPADQELDNPLKHYKFMMSSKRQSGASQESCEIS